MKSTAIFRAAEKVCYDRQLMKRQAIESHFGQIVYHFSGLFLPLPAKPLKLLNARVADPRGLAVSF